MRSMSAVLLAAWLLLTPSVHAGEVAQHVATDDPVRAQAIQLAATPVFLISPNSFCERDGAPPWKRVFIRFFIADSNSGWP